MGTPKTVIWEIEPHTLAKHEILRRYLVAWYPILGQYSRSLVFIDGFCGPGKYSGGEVGSPIVALEEALKHKDKLKHVYHHFLFLDERKDRIEQLNHEISKLTLPDNYKIHPVVGEFDCELNKLFDSLDTSGNKLPPTFAFIDPFGFKGLPFTIVRKLLRVPKSEVFINIMVDPINRFLDHPNEKTKQHIVSLFGTDEVLSIADNSTNRISNLRLLYQEQLTTCASFVRYFEMRDCDGRTIYYLFFASNHPLGLIKMKEAFWKIDPSSGYCFSDATDPNQLILFEIDETPKLANMITNNFSQKRVTVANILKFVEEKTAFLETHMRSALKLLESENKISVESTKTDGKQRIKNTFPENVIVNIN